MLTSVFFDQFFLDMSYRFFFYYQRTGDGVKYPIPNRGQSTLKTVKGDKHYDNPGNFEGTGIVRRAD